MTEEEFDELRPSACAIAYRMLGSVSEAEDVCDAFVPCGGARAQSVGEQPGDGASRWNRWRLCRLPRRRPGPGRPTRLPTRNPRAACGGQARVQPPPHPP